MSVATIDIVAVLIVTLVVMGMIWIIGGGDK